MIDLSFLDGDDFGKYKPIKHKTDYNALSQLILAVGRKFEPNFDIKGKELKDFYNNLSYYFCDDPRCEWDLTKGLFIHGKIGRGKSISLKIFRHIFLTRLKHGLVQGNKAFFFFACESMKNNVGDFYKLIEKGSVFTDEIGRETKDDSKIVNDFGTKEQPVSVGIHKMYRKFTDKGKLFHFTTNYWGEDGSKIRDYYGAEIRGRILEMCNVIELEGENHREDHYRKFKA